jgi:hypothetical protein
MYKVELEQDDVAACCRGLVCRFHVETARLKTFSQALRAFPRGNAISVDYVRRSAGHYALCPMYSARFCQRRTHDIFVEPGLK